MTLDIQDFAAETSGEVSADDIPPELRQRLNDKLADLTGVEGGPSGPSGDLYDAVVNAGSGSDDGSSPFETIQAAINNAESGDVISVEPGSYDGFEVNKENLTLFGPNAGIAGGSDQRGDEATIDAESDPIEFFGLTHAVAITDNDVEIDGFTVEGTDFSVAMSDAGLDGSVNNPEDAELRNNVLEGGVYHDGSTQFEIIEANTINGRLSLGGVDGAKVIDNDIAADDSFAIISVNIDPSNLVIEDNTLNNTDPSDAPYIRDLFGDSLDFEDLEDIIDRNEFQADGVVANRDDLDLGTFDSDRGPENAIVDGDFDLEDRDKFNPKESTN